MVGFFNGVIIAKLKVPAFIVTLGTSFIVRGIALRLSQNTTVIGRPRGVRNYGNDALIYMIHGEGGGIYFFERPEVTGALLRRMDRILPYPVLMTAFVVAIAIFVLRKTQFGRHTYAIGGSQEAALRTGIRVDRHIILLYVCCRLRPRVSHASCRHCALRLVRRSSAIPCCCLRSPRSSSVV